ncbi:ATP-binding protein [Synechococcus sp. PCC 7336]|uniref:ATP-binding protein n=1 Tax=Synechococcus sp. PCC 7336 TaxID=195250 RepID=UPI0003450B20|nr:ATP-binding protein [Synechococcus sp. PCC 7336]
MSQQDDPSPNQAENWYENRSLAAPGSIQPHGFLLAADEQFQIVRVSSNTQTFVGVAPQNLLGTSLQDWLSPADLEQVRLELAADRIGLGQLQLDIATPSGPKSFFVSVHRTDRLAILELEPLSEPQNLEFTRLFARVRNTLAQLQQAEGLEALLQLAADSIRALAGFDRVLVYQFDEREAGAVVAESKRDSLPSYLGLHYPASDIPPAARKLYRRGLFRFIPDLAAEPVALWPEQTPDSPPLDLSGALLRSVHPCCVEYHRNMQVSALLAFSLLRKGQLWGLVSCHHAEPKYLSYSVRSAVELLAQALSQELAHQVSRADFDYTLELKSRQAQFLEFLSQGDRLADALMKPDPRAIELVGAEGVAVCWQDEISLAGNTPNLDRVRELLDWAEGQATGPLFYTHQLPHLYEPAVEFAETASGLMLLQLARVRRLSILWFRPAILQAIDWAGEPPPEASERESDLSTLDPRHSFERWQETVGHTALPWQECEIESALDFRAALVGIIFGTADELTRIIAELRRSNEALDSFAYAASHDLKEPLRGIHNYAVFLLEDYGEILDGEGRDRLKTVVRLTRRMESLLDVLLRFSQLGRAELQRRPVDLNLLLDRAIEVARMNPQGSEASFRIPRPLPIVECDPVLTNEVFSNLIGNALKYNDSPEVWVEIGYLAGDEQWKLGWMEEFLIESAPAVIYVRDNGIGIRERHRETIFRLFKRLHAQKQYGGGTGAGLTIVKKIVERHGGRIWLESNYGKGSTFYFTLSAVEKGA